MGRKKYRVTKKQNGILKINQCRSGIKSSEKNKKKTVYSTAYS
jgi:hypothetical protein